MKKKEAELVAVLAEQQLKSGSMEMEGVRYTTTATARTTLTIDEPGLKKALTAKVFNKLTRSVLDRAKLEDAINQGEVDPAVVAQHTTTQTGATSIRLTKKEASAEEEAQAAPDSAAAGEVAQPQHLRITG